MQAMTYAKGGEVFVLDMGEPVKIYDLAVSLIKLSGLQPDIDIPIEITGLRPGEKLYEELLMSEEGLEHTKHNKIFVAEPLDIPAEEVNKRVEMLREFVQTENHTMEEIKKVVKKAVPTFVEAEEKNKKIVLLKLFISTLYLSTFTFGGGYVIVTLMKKKFVDEYHWIEENEMLDLVAIAQSSPGAIAVNGAIVVGYKLAGAAGIFVAILGTVLPPFVILSVISIFYNAFRNNWLISQLLEGMQAGVGAVIASVTVDMGMPIIKEKDSLSLVIMVGAFIAACVFSINVVYIVITCGIIGVIRILLSKRRSGK